MDYNDFTVVLPTLNEEETIGVLINRLTGSYKGIHISVVDDGSRDGTKREVGRISRKNRNVVFIDRKLEGGEKGLTASAVEGIIKSKTRFAIVMDADLQHPPKVVGAVASALAKGNGLVVATRADVTGWEMHRKIISKVLIGLGYALLVLRNSERCSDVFSGFFGVDARLFRKVYGSNRGRFIGGGYKILYDFLKSVRHNSIRISEVPYSFGLRKHGASKAGMKQGVLLFKSFFT